MTEVLSAKELRKLADDKETLRMQELNARKAKTEAHERELHDTFMNWDKVVPDAMDRLMRAVKNAVEQDQSEILVMRFPSDFCTDGGRAINNFAPDWPDTLQGRAKVGAEFFKEHLQPLGYKIRAEIMSYPNGMPGDVGLFLSW
jgi:hypothetical protein